MARKGKGRRRAVKKFVVRIFGHKIVRGALEFVLTFAVLYFGISGALMLAFRTDSYWRGVASNSMMHDVENWEQHYNNDKYYAGYDISKFPIRGGFERGDLLVIQGVSSPADVSIGDVIVVDRGPDVTPLVHRVVAMWEENGDTRFMLKGDRNSEPHESYYEGNKIVPGDYPIYPQQILGKVIFVIPKLGYISLWVQGS